jgi:hypothetical protein
MQEVFPMDVRRGESPGYDGPPTGIVGMLSDSPGHGSLFICGLPPFLVARVAVPRAGTAAR